MKLDRLKFAKLISYITHACGSLSDNTIEEIDSLIEFEVPALEQEKIYPTAGQIEQLIALMAEGTRKIEAIKLHRVLTGYGLKESKDAIERHWISKHLEEPKRFSPFNPSGI